MAPLERSRSDGLRVALVGDRHQLPAAAGDYRTAVLLLSYCGLRWGELAGLKVGRVDLMRRRLSVVEAVKEVWGKLIWGTPQSHHVRSVPIPRFLVDDLALVMAGEAPGDVVFTNPKWRGLAEPELSPGRL